MNKTVAKFNHTEQEHAKTTTIDIGFARKDESSPLASKRVPANISTFLNGEVTAPIPADLFEFTGPSAVDGDYYLAIRCNNAGGEGSWAFAVDPMHVVFEPVAVTGVRAE